MKELKIILRNKIVKVTMNNAGWITVHPNGKQEKGHRVKIEKGEDLQSALARKTGKPKESFDKFKDVKPKSKSLKQLQAESKKAVKLNKELRKIMRKVQVSKESNVTPTKILKAFFATFKNYDKKSIMPILREVIEYSKSEPKQTINTFTKEVKDKDGKIKREWTPERQKLHSKILAKIVSSEQLRKAQAPVGKKPVVTMLGGRGGSGKSKFAGMVYDPEKTIVLDADAIKEMIPEYKGYNAFDVHEESSFILKKAIQMAQEAQCNIVIDATMKSYDSTAKRLKTFKDAGYDIEMYYMHLPREKSAQRALSRFLHYKKDGGEKAATAKGFTQNKDQKTGRYVPLDILLGMKNNEKVFMKLLGNASKWAFYDNDVERGEEPKLVQSSDDKPLKKQTKSKKYKKK